MFRGNIDLLFLLCQNMGKRGILTFYVSHKIVTSLIFYLQELVSVHGHHELLVTDDQARLAPHLSNAIRTRAH